MSYLKMGRVEEFNAFRRSHPNAIIDLSKAALDGIDLQGIDLRDAKLTHASLRDSSLKSAKLCRADLTGACLTRANLRGADLSSACLMNSDLKRAILDGCILTNANLDGADMAGTILPYPEKTGSGQREMETLTEKIISRKKRQELCNHCPEEGPLPLKCPAAHWPPSSCKKWIEAEMNLGGLFTRIAAERKLIRGIPEEDFEDFIRENESHLILIKWKKNKSKLITKQDYLQWYAEILFKLM